MKKYKLLIDIPLFKKNSVYLFDFENDYIYFINDDNNVISEFPMRESLAGYLWLLLAEDENYYFEEVL